MAQSFYQTAVNGLTTQYLYSYLHLRYEDIFTVVIVEALGDPKGFYLFWGELEK